MSFPCGVYIFPVPVWVVYGYSGFYLQSKDMIRLPGASKSAVGFNGCLFLYDKLATCPGCSSLFFGFPVEVPTTYDLNWTTPMQIQNESVYKFFKRFLTEIITFSLHKLESAVTLLTPINSWNAT